MKARQLFERYGAAAAAPTEAPPKPTTKPSAPPAPSRPVRPEKHPNPFRRRTPGVDPGPMPRPKARRQESLAKSIIRRLQ